MLGGHRDKRRVARIRSSADVLITAPKHAVLVDVSALAIGYTDDLDPLPRDYRILEVTPRTLSAREIEDIETDPVGPVFGIPLAVNSEEPFFLPV